MTNPRILVAIEQRVKGTVYEVQQYVHLVAAAIRATFSRPYWSSVWRVLYVQDVWMGTSKPFVLGFVITSVACHMGLRTTGGTQGVGQAATRAVVVGSVAVIAIDFFLTRLMISLWY